MALPSVATAVFDVTKNNASLRLSVVFCDRHMINNHSHNFLWGALHYVHEIIHSYRNLNGDLVKTRRHSDMSE